MRPTRNPSQKPADVAVVVPTLLRPSLLTAVRSVYRQNFDGRLHLLIGIDGVSSDAAPSDPSLLDRIEAECPDHVMLTIVDPGYSTSARHGGMHANHYGGALRTILSFMANSPLIAYLDDNDWWGANHLYFLRTAIAGRAWAWSGRWLVDPQTQWPICKDEWDSVGPGNGINADRFGGFVQPSGLMLDALACIDAMPLWSKAVFSDGGGEDRLIFERLRRDHDGAATGQFTCYCSLSPEALMHEHHRAEIAARGLTWPYFENIINHIKTLSVEALESFDRGALTLAQNTIDEILKINPFYAPALALSARIAHLSGPTGDAIPLMLRALEIDDGRRDWFDQLALWLEQAGRAPEAHRVRTTLTRRFGPSA